MNAQHILNHLRLMLVVWVLVSTTHMYGSLVELHKRAYRAEAALIQIARHYARTGHTMPLASVETWARKYVYAVGTVHAHLAYTAEQAEKTCYIPYRKQLVERMPGIVHAACQRVRLDVHKERDDISSYDLDAREIILSERLVREFPDMVPFAISDATGRMMQCISSVLEVGTLLRILKKGSIDTPLKEHEDTLMLMHMPCIPWTRGSCGPNAGYTGTELATARFKTLSLAESIRSSQTVAVTRDACSEAAEICDVFIAQCGHYPLVRGVFYEGRWFAASVLDNFPEKEFYALSDNPHIDYSVCPDPQKVVAWWRYTKQPNPFTS